MRLAAGIVLVLMSAAWTSDLRLPGQAPLQVRSQYARTDRLRGRQMAVVTSRIAGPFAFGAGGISYGGTMDSRSTTWLDPTSGKVAKVDSTVDTDFTATVHDDPRTALSLSGEYRLQLESTDPPRA